MIFNKATLLTVFSAIWATAHAGCSYEDGNYYCSQTNAIVYEGIGYSGSYSDVTDIDESSCQCSSETKSFSGTLSPLDEELSVHFRGPLKLLQFGVYYPSSSSSKVKRDEDDEECQTTVHAHHHHRRAVDYVSVTATVYVDQDGNTISGTTSASTAEMKVITSESAASSTDGAVPTSDGNDETTSETSSKTSSKSSSSSSSSSSSASSTTSSSSSGSGWSRSSYFTPGSKDNVTFLNHKGGSGSGTFSYCFGNSISYCGSDGESASSSSVALDEVTIDSNVEFLIMSGVDCDDSSAGDCGYYRSGIPAYHGFAGATKMFVFEFEMPTATDSATTNYDMPAIWLLNAKIPRTLQYGSADCSCWSTGCGELDLFEILSSGSDKLISHLHDGQGDNGSSSGGGGSQDYFQRPTDSSMKAAAIFYDGEVHIVVLDDDVDFSDSLDTDTVSEWLNKSGSTASI
ncbi:hypothetical protein KL921_003334 [Ogataea angusta]|uniref:glucan endo-1,3-beta-D-glucosidase n=1 Tax=Pichia angusta TaxID=870730 RepID=A0AAN6DGB6_PICAN|nr:uncharacterized protein KL928_003572 [Ogataea angusta]KAG7809337.1 hypothetical protein KL921_003334 [Ogataea angusta]KAG7817673.1 hypothetical protein KL928_003572 [Ogataea angusta]KAG7822620.1 hypothetical protein KL909_003785 [Ogataea angusta]KAG7845362.1 hypothetical protein KL941_003208 [Ogataea angusta]KAG7858148.1 hypothetical protein KL919_003406 [Ogataea angusta]